MSYRERQESLERRARIAQSRSNPDNRQQARNALAGVFSGITGGIKNAYDNFKEDWRIARDPSLGQQEYGTSPLQQAMHLEQAGNMNPQAQRMLDHYRQNSPDEYNRQAGLMADGKHGDYGRTPMGTSIPNSVNTAPIASQDLTQQAMPEGVAGAPEPVNTANMSQAVADGNTDVVNQNLLMHKMMRDPSKMTSKGVSQMQQMLNNLGMTDKDGNPLSVDGKMGPLTASAMERWRAEVPNISSTGTGEPLESPKVVSGVSRANRWGQGEVKDGVTPITSYQPYGGDGTGGYENEWDFYSRGRGRGHAKAGYQDIQQTIGNPANDPVMWGVDDLKSITNPLTYQNGQVVPQTNMAQDFMNRAYQNQFDKAYNMSDEGLEDFLNN